MGKKKNKHKKKVKKAPLATDYYKIFESPDMYVGYDPDNAPPNEKLWLADLSDWHNNYGVWLGRHGEKPPDSTVWNRAWWENRIATAVNKSAYQYWLWLFMSRHKDVATPDFIMDPPADWYAIDFDLYLKPDFSWSEKELARLEGIVECYEFLAKDQSWFAFVK